MSVQMLNLLARIPFWLGGIAIADIVADDFMDMLLIALAAYVFTIRLEFIERSGND